MGHVCVWNFIYKMDLSSKRVPENGSQPIESVSVVQSHVRILNAYDLVKVGLSSTFAIAVFFGIGYVVKHVAGPSAILSVVLAAFLAYLVGKIEFHSVVHFFPLQCDILCKNADEIVIIKQHFLQIFFFPFNNE